MAQRTITYVITQPDGGPWAGALVTIDFRLALIERHLGLDTEPRVQARSRRSQEP